MNANNGPLLIALTWKIGWDSIHGTCVEFNVHYWGYWSVWCGGHMAHWPQHCHNSKCAIFEKRLLKVLNCCNFLRMQRRHNCSPAASFANCVMTLYIFKVHLQTFLSIPINQKFQILSCDTLVANERYVPHLSAPFRSFQFLSLLMFVPVSCTERRLVFSTPLHGTQFRPLFNETGCSIHGLASLLLACSHVMILP